MSDPTFDEVTRQIFARFIAQWVDGGNNPLTVVNLDDETMAEPDGVPWVRVSVRESQSYTKAIGNGRKRYERRGTAWIQVFAPAGDAGVNPANGFAVKARAIFEGKRIAPSIIFDGGARLIPLGFDGQTWYVITVGCPFRYTETL